MIAQLTEKLNPFSKQDPYTRLDCTVVRADITDGKVKASPVLMQSEKVVIAADGRIDLATEQMVFDFATRPRKGIGISPGMFTNPFLRVEGTLMHPRLGIGTRGLASGAVAAATAGLSVVAEGLLDRARGQQDSCKVALERAQAASQ